MTDSHTVERRMEDDARIILACSAGKQNQEIAAEFGTSVLYVSKWRKHFAENGFAGLEDEPCPGVGDLWNSL